MDHSANWTPTGRLLTDLPLFRQERVHKNAGFPTFANGTTGTTGTIQKMLDFSIFSQSTFVFQGLTKSHQHLGNPCPHQRRAKSRWRSARDKATMPWSRLGATTASCVGNLKEKNIEKKNQWLCKGICPQNGLIVVGICSVPHFSLRAAPFKAED